MILNFKYSNDVLKIFLIQSFKTFKIKAESTQTPAKDIHTQFTLNEFYKNFFQKKIRKLI